MPAASILHPLAPELLKRLLRYEPETGKFFWLARSADLFAPGFHSAETQCARWNSRFAGQESFTCLRPDGYRHTNILGRTYSAHRVAWALVTGEWAPSDTDHIDGDRGNNVFSNLRAATRTDNARNAGHHNPSGAMGVYRYRDGVRWTASIWIDGHSKHLGVFSTFEEAAAARAAAQHKHGFHPNHGRKQKEHA